MRCCLLEMNSQQLRVSTQAQSSQHTSMEGGGAHEAQPLTEELLAVDTAGRETIIFLWGCGYW